MVCRICCGYRRWSWITYTHAANALTCSVVLVALALVLSCSKQMCMAWWLQVPPEEFFSLTYIIERVVATSDLLFSGVLARVRSRAVSWFTTPEDDVRDLDDFVKCGDRVVTMYRTRVCWGWDENAGLTNSMHVRTVAIRSSSRVYGLPLRGTCYRDRMYVQYVSGIPLPISRSLSPSPRPKP